MAAVLPSVLEPSPSGSSGAAADGLTSSRIRRWGFQSAISVIDQGLNALVGFGVNLVLARWLPSAEYGAFAVTFAIYLFVSGFHNVLLLEPLSVLGPSRHAERLPAYFRAQLFMHAAIVGALSIVVAICGLVMMRFGPANPLGIVLVACGASLPLLLLLWLTRRICYVVKKPAIAAAGSAIYVLAVMTSFAAAWKAGVLSPQWGFLLMGLSSLISSIVLFYWLGIFVTGKSESALRWKQILRENWTYGRWLLGSAVLYSATNQVQMVLAAGILGLGAAGTLRAMQIPSLVMTQVITATGLLVLPVFASHFGRGATRKLIQQARWVSVALGGFALTLVLLLALFSRVTEKLLYGGKYAPFAQLMAVLALIPVMNGLAAGYSMALRATQKPQFDLISNLVAAPVGLLSALMFMRWWGVAGAAFSMVLGFATLTLATFVCFRLFSGTRIEAAAETPAEAVP